MSREMFAVKINQTQLEYDVNSIVKAFYPGEMIQVLTPDVSEEKRREWEDKIRMDICLDENSARISVTDGEERKEYNWKNNPQGGICKNEFKKFFYQTLCSITGKKLPWGNLTGIRPTKIAMGLLEEGKTGAQIMEAMETEHFVSEEKAARSGGRSLSGGQALR